MVLDRHQRVDPAIAVGAITRPDGTAEHILDFGVDVELPDMGPVHVKPEGQASIRRRVVHGRRADARCVVGFPRSRRFDVEVEAHR